MAASSIAEESPEIAAVSQNLVAFSDTISDNLSWFANKLVEEEFITQPRASFVLSDQVIGPAEKASILLDSVLTVLRNTDEKKEWFDKLIAIFSPEAACAELVDGLKRSHASMNSDTSEEKGRFFDGHAIHSE